MTLKVEEQIQDPQRPQKPEGRPDDLGWSREYGLG